MDHDEFWRIIEESKPDDPDDQDEQLDTLGALLGALGSDELIRFDRIMRELTASAYAWDLWGAAYIINGGCSDDGFEYFLAWLISRGRETFERALQDADALADLDIEDEAEFESLAYVAQEAWEQTREGEMPVVGVPLGEPSGLQWDEDGDDLRRRFPRLALKHGW